MTCREYGCWGRATALMQVPHWLDLHPVPLCAIHARNVGDGISLTQLPKEVRR